MFCFVRCSCVDLTFPVVSSGAVTIVRNLTTFCFSCQIFAAPHQLLDPSNQHKPNRFSHNFDIKRDVLPCLEVVCRHWAHVMEAEGPDV